MTADPRMSVVIAVRNGAASIQRCLDSVFDQTLRDRELIVIDGGSGDGTQTILEQNASRIDYWESAPDRGVYHAWNKALAHVHGDWVYFLGSDDRLKAPTVLAEMNEALLDAEPRHRVAYATVEIVDGLGEVVGRAGRPWAEVRDGFRRGMVFDHGSTFHHRSLFERHGPFDERFRIAGDYELLLRALLTEEPKFVSELVVAQVAAGGMSDRPEFDGTRAREKHRARRMHGLTAVPEWRSPDVIRAVTRAWLTRIIGREKTAMARGAFRRLSRRANPTSPS